jgi:nitroreductase
MKPYSSVSVPGAFAARPSLSPSEFPHEGSPVHQLEYLTRFAILAPSGHNTQPWRFRIAGPVLEIHADFSRAMPVCDPQNRELVMSCGAALLTIRVAARNFGLTCNTELCPDTEQPDLLARLELSGRAPSGRTDHKLFKAIFERRTNRMPFDSRPIPRALLYRWQRAAMYEDAWLHIVESEADRRAIAELIVEGERMLGASREYRSELSRWLRSNDSLDRDGLPGYSLGLGDLSSRVAPQVTFPFGGVHAKRSMDLVMHASAFVILGTAEDNPESWMIAGQALARVLLAAQGEGAAASFFLQPIEIPELREKLTRLLGEQSGYPQIAFRLGYGPKVPPTPRRPLAEVLTVEQGACEPEDAPVFDTDSEETDL